MRLFAVLSGLAILPACGAFHDSRSQEIEQSPASRQGPQRALPDLPIGLARDDDYVVRVVAGEVTCSGTLIASNLVLTAHHCVSTRDDVGDFGDADVSPKDIRIELGGDDLPWGEVGVRALVTPPCGYAAGHGDIAILVLERDLVGLATAPVRLKGPPEKGERIDPIGFGRCALSSRQTTRRREREGGAVTDVWESRFRLSASICPGDSGGPALDAKGRVVGVISASAMDGSERTRGRSEFTRLDRWREVFAVAKLLAEGRSPAEVPPVSGCDEAQR